LRRPFGPRLTLAEAGAAPRTDQATLALSPGAARRRDKSQASKSASRIPRRRVLNTSVAGPRPSENSRCSVRRVIDARSAASWRVITRIFSPHASHAGIGATRHEERRSLDKEQNWGYSCPVFFGRPARRGTPSFLRARLARSADASSVGRTTAFADAIASHRVMTSLMVSAFPFEISLKRSFATSRISPGGNFVASAYNLVARYPGMTHRRRKQLDNSAVIANLRAEQHRE